MYIPTVVVYFKEFESIIVYRSNGREGRLYEKAYKIVTSSKSHRI